MTERLCLWRRLVVCCLTPLTRIVLLYRSGFIGGGNQSTFRKPADSRNAITNVITECCTDYTLL